MKERMGPDAIAEWLLRNPAFGVFLRIMGSLRDLLLSLLLSMIAFSCLVIVVMSLLSGVPVPDGFAHAWALILQQLPDEMVVAAKISIKIAGALLNILLGAVLLWLLVGGFALFVGFLMDIGWERTARGLLLFGWLTVLASFLVVFAYLVHFDPWAPVQAFAGFCAAFAFSAGGYWLEWGFRNWVLGQRWGRGDPLPQAGENEKREAEGSQ